MQGKKSILLTGTLLLSATLWGCSGSSNSVVDQSQTSEQELYAGSAVCGTCHQEIYDTFYNSGHPYKLNKVVNNTRPTYPFSTLSGALAMITDEDGTTDNSLGTPGTYADVSYVIGGYGWKSRWIDADGFIVTGSEVQYNLEDGSMVAYHDNEVDKPYNCGNCHTTGWRHYDAELNDYRQDDLPGMDGTFAEPGIGCESCHGGGLQHVDSQDKRDIVRIADARTTSDFLATNMGLGLPVACSECHTRDGEKDYPNYISGYNVAFSEGPKEGGRIDASGSLTRHHEQYDELLGVDPDTGNPLGKHLAAGVTCIVCHDPHKTVKYQDQAGESGLVAECTDCHGIDKPFEIFMPADSAMAGLNCIDCHMPLMAKSAVSHDAVGTGPKTGDIAAHIFKIDMSEADQFTDGGAGFTNPWITKDFACLTCHNGVDYFDLSTVNLSEYQFHVDTMAQDTVATYVGSSACAGCHADKYDAFINSGHPYKLNKVVNNTVPTYPFSDIDGALEQIADDNGETDNSLGTPADYSEVSYVIGGYGWKSRWIDSDGFIVTGSKVQYNLEDNSWSAYHNDEVDKPYNCGNCHTTGWRHYDPVDNAARQDALPGMDGTFAEPGIQCEACHGAGSIHVATLKRTDIVRIAEARTTDDFMAADMGYGLPVACSECHTRDGEKDYPTYVSGAENAGYSDGGTNEGGRIDASGGLVRHHEQYDELLGINPDNVAAGGTGKHLINGVTCITCHDPHTTTKFQETSGDTPGVQMACLECHADKNDINNFTVAIHVALNCVDCHMPRMAKSAITTDGRGGTSPANSGVVFGDIRTHIFRVDLTKDPSTQQYTPLPNDFAYPWITSSFACGSCHADPSARVGLLPGGKVHK